MNKPQNEYIEYYKKHKDKVKEFINPQSKYIFILESPHKEEVNNGYVTCGTSGKSMAKVLNLSDNKSLGDVLNDGELTDISVLNISKVPLQKMENEKIEVEESVIDKIDQLRGKYTTDGKASIKTSGDPKLNDFEDYILKDFKERIKQFTEDKIVIVCGNFAKVYFKEALKDKKIKFNKVLYVLHPSRNQWTNYIKCKSDMDQLLEYFPDK